jgi:hypothetical protein
VGNTITVVGSGATGPGGIVECQSGSIMVTIKRFGGGPLFCTVDDGQSLTGSPASLHLQLLDLFSTNSLKNKGVQTCPLDEAFF